ncbi:MAG: T9SS type A sorting domain-containing protein [Flavobacteriia bacterium]|nr:T9SS type A sorting domain-containing protein [Flavobacteriia bacterium]
MKKLMTFGVIMLSLQSNAQTIPNGGFEDWSIPPQASYEEPTNWFTLNILNFFDVPVTTEKSTDAHSGTYAALCKTTEADMDQNGSIDDTVAGIMTIETSNGQNTYEGFPINSRPDSLIAWIKYTPGSGDSFGAMVNLAKWNAISNTSNTIATGQLISSSTYSTYTRVAIAITYNSNEIPDTAKLIFTCSANEPALGSEFWVDDLSFVTASAAGLEDLDHGPVLSLYPNPSDNYLTVTSTQNTTVYVFNTLGEIIDSQSIIAGSNHIIATSAYSNGVYFLKAENSLLERFIVRHP